MNKHRSRHQCLVFVASHAGGTRSPAFPFGWRYRFDAPELKRAPFRASTINSLFDTGHLTDQGGTIVLTRLGESALRIGGALTGGASER